MRFSIIIPVYNRPDEVRELLKSLTEQTYTDYEVIVVEDGSSLLCQQVVEEYHTQLPIAYYYKDNSGPGLSRNYGAERAQGEYFIILDSDVILPNNYLVSIDSFLQQNAVDAFGGPDCAHSSFTNIQKAINYGMTSFFTTGGIRGGKKKLDVFYPRSFNMGIRSEVWHHLGGFRNLRFGEDIDFSYRIVEGGYSTALIPQAYVYHKRRTDFTKFFRQVHNSGRARINLSILHPGTLKLVHCLPAAFTVGLAVLVIGGCWCPLAWLVIALYALLLMVDSTWKNGSIQIGVLSILAAFVQLIGYGSGFIIAAVQQWILKRGNQDAFKDTFYK